MDMTDMYPTHAHPGNNQIYATEREVCTSLEFNF